MCNNIECGGKIKGHPTIPLELRRDARTGYNMHSVRVRNAKCKNHKKKKRKKEREKKSLVQALCRNNGFFFRFRFFTIRRSRVCTYSIRFFFTSFGLWPETYRIVHVTEICTFESPTCAPVAIKLHVRHRKHNGQQMKLGPMAQEV